MPIKFRCEHCRQFLGISHTMAGTIVDCPTCGRSVRVPDEQGRVAPLPKPRLDLADSGLAEALDELGAIGKQPVLAAKPAVSPPTPSTEAVRTIEPVSLPAPIALPDPYPVAAVPAGAPFSANASASGTPASDAASHKAGLATLAAGGGIVGERAEASRMVRHVPRGNPFRAPAVRAALAGTIVAGMLLGFIAGRMTAPRESSLPREPPAAAVADPKPPEQRPADARPALSGRVTFRTREGNTMPDDGARVIVFPATRRGTAKLSIVGFRPADSDEDFAIARESFRAAGGAVARVNEAGEFHLELPAAGTYRVLAISHYQSREGTPETSAEFAALLEAWFDRPTALLGQVRFETGQVRYNGEQPVGWDHTFELP